MSRVLQKRISLLRELLFLERDLKVISKELNKFEWDCEEELVIIDKNVLSNLFNGFLAKTYSIDTLESWANLIECREDIAFEEKYQELIKEVLAALANQDISNPIDEATISAWLSKLK